MINTTQGNEALIVRHQIGIASGFGLERWPASRLETPSGFVGIRSTIFLDHGLQLCGARNRIDDIHHTAIGIVDRCHSDIDQKPLLAIDSSMSLAVLPDWSLAPVVRALQALRGIALVNAATLVAELDDLTRFANPRQLMAYLGLVPSEHSSGQSRR